MAAATTRSVERAQTSVGTGSSATPVTRRVRAAHLLRSTHLCIIPSTRAPVFPPSSSHPPSLPPTCTLPKDDDSGGDAEYYDYGHMSWDECHDTCSNAGKSMLCVENYATEEAIWNWMEDHGTGGEAWLGYHDVHDEGEWEWVDGCDSSFTNWNDGEPNDSGGNEDYAMNSRWGGWNDCGNHCGGTCICQTPPTPAGEHACVCGPSGGLGRFTPPPHTSWAHLC